MLHVVKKHGESELVWDGSVVDLQKRGMGRASLHPHVWDMNLHCYVIRVLGIGREKPSF